MKLPVLSFLFFLLITQFINPEVFSQNVGIGTTSPHPNAVLEIQATNKGLLIPRGDAATRLALSTNTAKGLLMYDTVLNSLWIHNGNGVSAGWNNVSLGTNFWQLNGGAGNEIKSSNTGGFWSANPSAITTDPGIIQPPASGAGTRLMWIPAKSAFRVGTVDGPYSGLWDVTNIGAWSFACGRNTLASGDNSLAMGATTLATGFHSTAIGFNTVASGNTSTAIGYYTEANGPISTAMGGDCKANGAYSTAMGGASIASGDYSSAFGFGNVAEGENSIVFGGNNIARAAVSLVIGRFNDTIASSSPNAWVATDPVLYVGNGSSFGSRSNAAVIYKNGNMRLQNQLQLQGAGGGTGIELANGVNGKEVNAGRIGYGLFSPDAVDIVGGGTTNANRKINFYAESGATFNGCVFATNVSCPSDIRLKKDIIPLHDALKSVTRLNGYNYYWKDNRMGSGLQTGVIAQEVKAIMPELISAKDNGELAVNYNGLIPYLIEAIKEQQQQIEQLREKIENLTKK